MVLPHHCMRLGLRMLSRPITGRSIIKVTAPYAALHQLTRDPASCKSNTNLSIGKPIISDVDLHNSKRQSSTETPTGNPVPSLLTKLIQASDLTHTLLAVGAASLLLPTLPLLPCGMLAATHVASVAVGFGTQAWVSLVAGPTMFMNMSRGTFGDIQARLFPKMGQVCTATGLVSLVSYYVAHKTSSLSLATDTETILLASSLLINATNAFLLFPLTSNLMRRLMNPDTKDKRLAGRNFGIVHGTSVTINFLAMLAMLVYIYMMGCKIEGSW